MRTCNLEPFVLISAYRFLHLNILFRFTNNLLSTAQQVWLQKFGGAKDPMKQFSDIIKDERLDINKSVPGLSSTKKEARQAEKLTTEGPRPGERLVVCLSDFTVFLVFFWLFVVLIC